MTQSHNEGIETSWDDGDGFVTVIITGELRPPVTIKAMQSARKVCEEHDCRRILVDVRQVTQIAPFIDAYMLARDFRKLTGLDISYACAFLYDPAKYPADRARTIELTAKNWDGIRMRTFASRDEAIAHLRK
jgi:hypothetical protein